MSTSGILIEQTIQQTLSVLIILFIGIICYKTKLIDDATNSKLSSILLTLVQPILIFTSFQMEYKPELIDGLLISLALAFFTHLAAITISYIFIRKKRRKKVLVDGVPTVIHVDNEDVTVERLTSSYANMGFIGIPLAYGIFGNVGVFYTTAYVMAFNTLMWTHGVIMISGTKNLDYKDIFKKLRTPAIIAIFLGLIFFIFQIKLPSVVSQSLEFIGNINTPFGMLIAGATIAKSNLLDVFTKNLRKYYMVFIKLLLIPIVLMLIYVRLPIDYTVKTIAILMSATPTTAVGTLLTIKYKKNSVLAAEIFAMTTILCVITIPLVMKLAELLS